MPNQRSKNQAPITVWLDKDLLDLVEQAVQKQGRGIDRSQLIRDAIKAKLEEVFGKGTIPDALIYPPPRTRPPKTGVIIPLKPIHSERQSQEQSQRIAEEPPP
jgi:Arc/MetJ-type ribon-helix-helix transcriptional regulator